MQTIRRRLIVVVPTSLVVLISTATVKATTALCCGSSATSLANTAIADDTKIVHDEAAVREVFGYCAELSPRPFIDVVLRDGRDKHKYAILLREEYESGCYMSIAYFFDGEQLLGKTRQLPPRSSASVVGMHTVGASRVAVYYAMSNLRNTVCAANGIAGVIRYIYSWRQGHLFVVSVTAPKPPK